MMSMGKIDEYSNIERLLQVVETPDNFDKKELEAVMNDENTKGYYSLLSDIEAVKSIDTASLPDVNAEWSSFARWMHRRRLSRGSNKLRRIHNWHAYISVAAVVLFALFITVPIIMMDKAENDTEIVHTTNDAVVGLKNSRENYSDEFMGKWNNDKFLNRRITPAHSYALPKSCFDLEFEIMVDNTFRLSGTGLEYLFNNFSRFNEFKPFNITIGNFSPKGYSHIDAFYLDSSVNY